VVSREHCERIGLRLVSMATRGSIKAMKLLILVRVQAETNNPGPGTDTL
jgi:hypothetical protein